MNFLPYDNLTIPDNRQRQEFPHEAIEILAESIRSKGLLHPVVVRDDGFTLVAGERRTRAILHLHSMGVPFNCSGERCPPDSIPTIPLGELTEFQLREAELEENILREDLTWTEKAKALSELHELRVEQRGEYDQWNNPLGQSVKATAEEVFGDGTGANSAALQEARLISKHLSDPDVAKAKTPKEALKVIKKKAATEMTTLLAETYAALETPHEILHGDCLTILPTLPSSTFSVICTDPPYGVDAHEFGDMADATHQYDDSLNYFLDIASVLAHESYRVAADSAHAYVFCDIRRWNILAKEFAAAGWDVWNVPLIWSKGNGMLPRPDHGPRRTYEAILFANKGERRTTAIFPDVVTVRALHAPTFGAEKPAELFRDLLSRSALPGERVLDCFAGAGPIIPAANSLSLRATAIELDRGKWEHIVTRQDEECGGGVPKLDDLI